MNRLKNNMYIYKYKMRSKQNKLKRKISRGQKAGRPLKDLEKRISVLIP